MAIFSLLAKLGLDGTAFETGLKRSQSLAKGIGREISGTLATVFTVDKLAQFGMEAINTAGKLNDLSTQLGVSSKFLQEMKFAAEMGGSSLDEVASAIQKIAIVRMKALAGDKASIELMEKFKVAGKDIKSLKLEDVFFKIGRQFEGEANPERLVGPLREIAGRGAASLIPAMVEGLSDAAEQAHRLGMVMSDEVIATLDEANDRVEIMNKTMTAGVGSLVSNFIQPVFRHLEALGASLQTEAVMIYNSFKGERFAGKSVTDNLKHIFGQMAQAYTSSLDEQTQDVQNRQEARQKRAATRRNIELTAEGPTKTIAVSAATGDQLAKTGGFTAFQSNMDRYFGAVKTQAQDIRDISRNTQRTAEAVEE